MWRPSAITSESSVNRSEVKCPQRFSAVFALLGRLEAIGARGRVVETVRIVFNATSRT